MNPNHPEFKEPRLSPITYHVEEYEPAGMEGIFITECWLDIDIFNNEPEISGISFPADRKPNCLIPRSLEMMLIKLMQDDHKLMEYITEACMEEYTNNH